MAYSRDGFPHSLPAGLEQSFISAPVNTGVPLLDQDINLMQSIQLARSNDAMAQLYTCGWIFKGDLTNFGINNMEMETSTVVCHDRVKQITDTQISGSNRIDIPTTVGRPAGQTWDIVFLEIWVEELRELDTIYKWGNVLNFDPGALSNDIIDTDVGLTAAARMQDRYRIRVVGETVGDPAIAMTTDPVTIQGKKAVPELVGNPLFNFDYNAADTVYFKDTTVFDIITGYDDFDGQVLAFPIAMIERTVGDDDLNNGTVTDLRNKVAMKVSAFSPAALSPSPSDCAIEIAGQVVSSEVIDVVDSGDSVTIDFCDGNVHFIDLAPATADVTVTLLNPVAGGIYHITFKQHPTTPVQLIWPGDVDFVLGIPHLLSLIGGDIDVFQLLYTANPGYRTFPMGPRTFNVPPCQQDVTVTGPVVLDLDICSSWRLFLASAPNPFDLTFTNAQPGGVYSIKFVQGVGGGVQANYLSSITWLNNSGLQENLTSNSNGVDIVTFYFDGGSFCAKLEGENGTPVVTVPALNDLTDVVAPAPSNGDVLTFQTAGSQWVPQPGGVAPHGLDDHSDVGIAGYIANQFLKVDGTGTAWVGSGFLTTNIVAQSGNVGTGTQQQDVLLPPVISGISSRIDGRRLVAGTNITLSAGTANSIVITAASGGGGTVTSVTGGSGISTSPGGGITTTGSIINDGVLSVGTGVGTSNFGTAQNPVIGVSAGIGVWGANGITGNIPGGFTNFASSGTLALSGLLMVIYATARVDLPASGGVIEARLLHNNAVIAGAYTAREAVPGNSEIQVALSAVVTSATASGNIVLQLRDTGSGTPVCNGCNIAAIQRLG